MGLVTPGAAGRSGERFGAFIVSPLAAPGHGALCYNSGNVQRSRPGQRGGSPLSPSPQTSLLPIAVGVVQLAVGWLSLAFPQSLDLPPYPDALRTLGRMAMVFIVAGVFTLLSSAARGHRSRGLPVLFAALGAVPFAVVAVAAVPAGAWSAALVGGAMGIGVLADAITAGAPRSRAPAVPALAAVVVVIAAGHGVLALAWPQALRVPPLGPISPFLPHLGAGLVAAAALLALGWAVPRLRAATQVAAALPLWGLAAALVPSGRWPGVLTYALLGSALAFEPLLAGMQHRRLTERAAQPRTVSDYEAATEAAAWGFVLLVALAGAAAPTADRRLGLALLILFTSVFTMVWFHLLPVRQAGLRRTVVGASAYSVLAGALVWLTGGLESPFFLIFAVPLIAVAWTHVPGAVVAPLAVPLALVALDAALLLRAGLGGAAVFYAAFPRAVGLALIAAFAYLLARRRAEDQRRVREARRQLEAVLGSMAEGLVVTDRDGRVTLSNPAAVALVGPAAAGGGQHLTESLPLQRPDGTGVPPAQHPVSRALAGQRVAWERAVAQGPRGPLPLAVAAGPLGAADGTAGAIVLLRDALAEVEAERMRDDFFFIASHELRTPLTVMKGNLEMALEVSPPALRTSLVEALHSVTRLIRLVNDFLDAARLEHGAVSLHLDAGHLPDLVRQAVETLRPDAERKGLALVYRPAGGLPAVRMDVERALQILLNLIGNSVQYSEGGAIEISHAVDGPVVETRVRDAGVGIAPEHHGQLFSRFGQVGRGLTRAGGGSGLGLYISRRLAEQMGGEVVLIHSAPGQGSTFALRLPAAGEPPGPVRR